jgi:hypothetical protein
VKTLTLRRRSAIRGQFRGFKAITESVEYIKPSRKSPFSCKL